MTIWRYTTVVRTGDVWKVQWPLKRWSGSHSFQIMWPLIVTVPEKDTVTMPKACHPYLIYVHKSCQPISGFHMSISNSNFAQIIECFDHEGLHQQKANERNKQAISFFKRYIYVYSLKVIPARRYEYCIRVIFWHVNLRRGTYLLELSF